MAGMRGYKHWSTGDKAMIAALSFAIVLALALGVFTVASMATHTYDVRNGWKALAGLATFALISYGALRKRLTVVALVEFKYKPCDVFAGGKPQGLATS
jgi:hypothetical protein